jgi:hypothetical protein
MTRTRIALTLTTLGLAGVLGLSGCGIGAGSSTATSPAVAVADVADEAYALQTVGFDTGLAADPAPSASASAAPDGGRKTRGERRAKLRKYLHKNTLHGEIAVQGKDGVKTIVVQRGAVTAVTSTGVTVKSTDGFTATWTFGDQLKIVQDRHAVAVSALKTGAEIGIAGTKDGSSDTARLIAVK